MGFGVIIIGDEILSGRRVDKHLPKVIQLLSARGLSLSWAEYIGDDPEAPRVGDARVKFEIVEPGRANVIGVARGTGGGRTLLLNGHTDTVGHDGYERPLEPLVEGDRLYGRGSVDMKGGVAAALWACAEAAKLELAGDVVVTAVCDEEFASIGTQAVAAQLRADAAIVTEPTALELCVAHKGFAWLEVEIAGRAAHGSQPQLGIDEL